MPSHIYLRLGRYEDAVTANERAAAADEDYIAQCNAQGMYPAAYYPHNLHFLWYAAMMEGRRELALKTAERLSERIPAEMAKAIGAIQAYLPVRMYTYVRFGMWDEALTLPAAAEGLPYAEAMRHYGRGLAFAAKGELEAAQAELEALEAIRGSGKLDLVVLRRADISDTLVGIAAHLVRAGMAKQRGEGEEEIKQLREAVAAQLSLPYSEPPFWHYPYPSIAGRRLAAPGRCRRCGRSLRRRSWRVSGERLVLAWLKPSARGARRGQRGGSGPLGSGVAQRRHRAEHRLVAD